MCTIRTITIPKFCINVEDLPSGEYKISLDINANTMIPKDDTSNECIVEMTVKYISEEGNDILFAIIRGNITDVDSNLKDEEKCNIIKEKAFPTIYFKLRNFIEGVLENANIKLPTIPPIENISL